MDAPRQVMLTKTEQSHRYALIDTGGICG